MKFDHIFITLKDIFLMNYISGAAGALCLRFRILILQNKFPKT